MDKYGYRLKKNTTEPKAEKRYHKTDLMQMTTFQLREICRREKLIQGIIDPMDKEELVRVILRFRGADEYFFIQRPDEAGWEAVERVFRESRLLEKDNLSLRCSSKITVYEGLAVGFYDGLVLPYNRELAGTNAFIVGGDGRLCAIMNVMPREGNADVLYLTMEAGMNCRESEMKNYSLYCMGRRESELLYQIYKERRDFLPQYLKVFRGLLLDFEVRKPISLSLPIAMDFGTSNTTAGVFLDRRYFEQMGLKDGERGLRCDQVNYALFYDSSHYFQETTLFPSAVGVKSLGGGEPELLFGYDAVRLANNSYIDEGFCVFYDIKRWIGDENKLEEISDQEGHRSWLSRKDLLKAYFTHVIQAVCNRFKCQAGAVHISCPVKQKAQFSRLFAEVLPECAVEEKDRIDEGVSVLYHTISGMMKKGSIEEGREYRALILDCGGGTTDLCSCSFRIWDKRAAYRMEINIAYENGDTDFGGNNLTYRVMQLLKVAVVHRLYPSAVKPEKEILAGYDRDVFRFVDQYGTGALYRELEEEYEKAEAYLPTRFRRFEQQSRSAYYQVKNNFYFLFSLAEMVKKEFYDYAGTLRVALSSQMIEENAVTWLAVDKWKLSVYEKERLSIVKEFPTVYISIYELELLLKADIYGVVSRFMGKMYEDGVLEDYSLIKLTGQSCKIDLFREALKEFVPGRTIQFGRKGRDLRRESELKMTCVDGAVNYLKDKKYGFADVNIVSREPALPYRITAYTHHGEEVMLIHCLKRNIPSGMISRNMEDLTLKLYLKDLEGKERYQYSCHSKLTDFEEKLYEEIHERYGEHIRQADTDDIAEQEVRFFIWARPEDWGFSVVPLYRRNRRLYMGKEEQFSFENDGWTQNFFDGMN